MNYNINIREEKFGATLNNITIGKRYYITKRELKDIIENNIFPKDIVDVHNQGNCDVKFTPLKDNVRTTYFSFADIAFIELTRACNLRCKHCLNSSGLKMGNELDHQEYLKLIKDMASAGIQEIRFTGGEPLLYRRIYELIELASSLGLYTSLGSNGTLINKKVTENLKRAGLNKAVISLDGTRDIHDFIRGAGNYDKTMHAIRCLHKTNIGLRVNAVIMKTNMDDVIRLAKELHKKKIHLFIRRFIESGRGKDYQRNMLSKQDYDYVRSKLQHELEEGPYINGHYLRNDEGTISRINLPFEIKGCKAGQRALAIMPNGDINLCGFLAAQGFPGVGNVRKINNWNKFWDDLHDFDRLKSLKEKLDAYNAINGIQQTYCLAYIQQYINKENKKC